MTQPSTQRNQWRLASGYAPALVLAATLGGPAVATAAGLADCAAIQSDTARLDCYDRLSGRVSGSSTRAAPPAEMSAPVVSSPAGGESASPSLIDRAWAFAPDSDRYAIGLYQRNYLLLANYTDRINERPFTPIFDALESEQQDLDSTEARFQISFKFRMWSTEGRRLGLWAAYTQKSQWQVYNDAISRPFRDTNYMPELILSFRPDVEVAGFHWRLLNLGYTHESNGRSDPISRSWDRLVAAIGIERDNFALVLRPWIRIDDSDSDDDNPDITDYLGHGDLTAYYKWRDHSFSLMGRGNPSTGKGSAELTWMSPRLVGPLRVYLRAFSGYGDTLIDYNWRQNAVGIGVALNDAL